MSDLVDRLRGKYVIPVRDGAGPLNGKDTFTRQFDTPPIHHEAAARIEALENALRNMTANFRTSLLLVRDHETRALGLDLVAEATVLLRSADRGRKE
jgi:hypothetical protein